jgi:hypothetical protein
VIGVDNPANFNLSKLGVTNLAKYIGSWEIKYPKTIIERSEINPLYVSTTDYSYQCFLTFKMNLLNCNIKENSIKVYSNMQVFHFVHPMYYLYKDVDRYTLAFEIYNN